MVDGSTVQMDDSVPVEWGIYRQVCQTVFMKTSE